MLATAAGGDARAPSEAVPVKRLSFQVHFQAAVRILRACGWAGNSEYANGVRTDANGSDAHKLLR
jgi:hypothetical protein